MGRRTHCQVCLSGNGQERNVTSGCMFRLDLENFLHLQLLVTVSSLAICSPCCNLIEMWCVFAARARKNLAALSQNSSEPGENAGGSRLKSQTQDLSRLLMQVLQSTDGPCVNTSAESSRDASADIERNTDCSVSTLVHPSIKSCSVVLNRKEVEKYLEEHRSICAFSQCETAKNLTQKDVTTCHVALEKTAIREWSTHESYCPLEMKIEIGSEPPSPHNASFDASSAPASPVAASLVSSSDNEDPDVTSQGSFDEEISSLLLDPSSGCAEVSVSPNVSEITSRKKGGDVQREVQGRISLRSASRSLGNSTLSDSNKLPQSVESSNMHANQTDQPQDVEKTHHKSKYNCTVCKTTFCHSNSLNRHYISISHKNNVKASKVSGKVSTHLDTSLIIFHCEICNASFNKKPSLKMHTKRHLKQKGIMLKSCDFCSKQFSSRKALTEHIFSHLSPRKYFCYRCKEIFNGEVELEAHVTSFSCKNLDFWQCNFCGKKLSTKKGYKIHLQKLHNIVVDSRKFKCVTKNFKCKLCDKDFTTGHNLDRHLVSIHTIESETLQKKTSTGHQRKNCIKCNICKRSFFDKSNLNRHMRNVHKFRKNGSENVEMIQKLRLTCSECNHPCRNLHQLRLHMLQVHKVDVPRYSCNKCDSSFLHRRNLERHLKVSHATGDFMCEICGASFSDFYILEHHIKQHQSADFACQVCSESFENNSSSLKDHVFWKHIFPTLPHTASEFWKPDVLLLECDFCSETFTSEPQLEKHTFEHLKQSKSSSKEGRESIENTIDSEMCELLDINGPLRKFFPCFACNEEFAQFSALRLHITALHKGAQQMQCKLCDKLCTKSSIYVAHLENRHTLNSGLKLQCPYCSNVLKNQGHFVRHFGGSLPPGLNLADCCVASSEKKKRDPKSYSCKFCENVYTSYMGHYKHVRDYHPEEWKLKCKLCDKKFLLLCKAMKHERFFHKDKLICPYCKKSFSKQNDLKHHVQQVHDGKPAFFCELCNLEFLSNVSLQGHNSKHASLEFTVHKAQISIETAATEQVLLDSVNDFPISSQESGSINCPTCCNLHFPTISQLQIHVFTFHQKINCYSCNECGAVFPSCGNLVEHVQNVHRKDASENTSKQDKKVKVGVRPVKAISGRIYECDKCGKQFQNCRSRPYIQHVSTCRPDVLCQGCGKSLNHFRKRGINMAKHETKCRTILRPYKCTKCSWKFLYKRDLQKHKWRHDLCWADKMHCSHCPLSFDSITKVLEHYTAHHMSQLPFPLFCKLCDFNCDNIVELKLHTTQHNQQLVHCNQCHRDVSVAQFKRCHILTCKSSVCSICSTECGSSANLFLHVQQDHETGNHSCLLCLNSFPSESNLQQHVMHNHGQTSFKCDICKVNISYKENLRSHIKLHIHSKTRCRICGREFASSSRVLQHFLKEHKDVIPPSLLKTFLH